jgi:hypothetical protein
LGEGTGFAKCAVGLIVCCDDYLIEYLLFIWQVRFMGSIE